MNIIYLFIEHQNDDHRKNKIDADERSKKEADDFSKYRSEECDTIPNSFSSPNSGDESFHMEDVSHSLEIADESTLDGEVGKRLNQMVPIPVSITETFIIAILD